MTRNGTVRPVSDERIHLVVVFGGQSAEHEVSCTTAAHVLAAADPERYRITPVGISTEGDWAISTTAAEALTGPGHTMPARLDPSGDPITASGVVATAEAVPERTVVLPLLHGPLGEDGTVQGLLELANLAYVGSGVLGSALAMDKAMAKRVLDSAGVPQAAYAALAEHECTTERIDAVAARLGLPCFVKPANMGSSVGITKAKTIDEVRDAVAHALTYDEWVVIEEAIDGREIEVAVIGNLEPFASVPGEIIPGDEFYSYDDKYLNGASVGVVPAQLTTSQSDEVRQLALTVFRALRCEGLARCDFFFEENGRGFLCNEVNTMPGFTPISMFPKMLMASGWTYGEIIDRLVDLAIERQGRRRRNTKH